MLIDFVVLIVVVVLIVFGLHDLFVSRNNRISKWKRIRKNIRDVSDKWEEK